MAGRHGSLSWQDGMILEPAKLAINTNDRVIMIIFISRVSISDLTFLLGSTDLNVFSW